MKNNHQTPLELLVPAGNPDIGITAIDHGADAVYIGAPRFSARANAGCTMDDIARLIDYAHVFNARVYLALNTILTDAEIKEAVTIATAAYEAGADGLIIQDMGLFEAELPPIPLIASTQTHNASPEKVKFLEDAGVSRVILARELSLEDIREIRAATTVELECFVHGALCVSYSGQCYMSQAAFGRSGNRGVCAQPCRLPYTLTDGNGKTVIPGKHLLSLKDLNLIGSLPAMIEAGVTSFKIEGRYKDASYVKNVTAAYRKALDQFIDAHPGYRKQSSGIVQFNFEPDLQKTFTRGYTPYFLHAPDNTLHQAAMDTPKSIGEPVGTVTRTEKDAFWIKGEKIQNGDGLCFIDRSGQLKGFRVEKVENGRIIPNDMEGVAQGVKLFRNHNHGFLKILDRKTAERKIRVSMVFKQTETEISLTITDEDGHTVNSSMPVSFEDARQPEKMMAQITTQLSSTGNTVFTVSGITNESEKTGFLPISSLNSLRRDALDQLLEVRKNSYAVQKRRTETVPPPVYPDKTLDYRANVHNRLARAFYERHGATISENAIEGGTSPIGKILMTTRYCIRRELGGCLKNKKEQTKLRAPLGITHGKRTYRLEFDCEKCRMHVMDHNE